MPAVTPLTASLAPAASGGVVIYQSQTNSIRLNDLIRVRYFDVEVATSAASTNLIRIINSGGNLTSITITDGGSGYSSAPTVVITGGGGTGATATATLSDGVVSSVTVTNEGSGYTSVPTVTFTGAFSGSLATGIANTNGLPSGLSAASAYNTTSYLTGAPTTIGTAQALFKVELYDYNTTGSVVTVRAVSYISVPITVIPVPTTATPALPGAEPDTEGAVAYTPAGGIDVFLDLQSMALSLALPKAEAVIAADAQVVNTPTTQLVIKPDQILDFNVRFTKGASVVDPSPATMRFGIGTKIGGPLLMLGSTFTKVGSGSGAYFKMRVTSDSLEFDAIHQDYYDEDAVEQINADNTPGREEPPAGLCELEFTTGSGATLATFRSDSLAVIIRRSLLAGI